MKEIERLQNENERLRDGFSDYTKEFLQDCEDNLIDNERVTKDDIEKYVLSLTIEELKNDSYIDIYGERFSTIAEDVLLNYDFDEYTYKWSEHLLIVYRKIVTDEILNDLGDIEDYICNIVAINAMKENAQQVIDDLEELLSGIKYKIDDIDYVDNIEDYCDVSSWDLNNLKDKVDDYIQGLIAEVEEYTE